MSLSCMKVGLTIYERQSQVDNPGLKRCEDIDLTWTRTANLVFFPCFEESVPSSRIFTKSVHMFREVCTHTKCLGGLGGAVNTKVDMRFKVMEANWLPERIRLKLLQMVGCAPS